MTPPGQIQPARRVSASKPGGIAPARVEDLDRELTLAISFALDEMSPAGPAKRVMVPTFLCEVRDDVLTRSSDVQRIFDNLPIREKELFWILGTPKRWDGYTRFAKDPAPVLTWFERYCRPPAPEP